MSQEEIHHWVSLLAMSEDSTPPMISYNDLSMSSTTLIRELCQPMEQCYPLGNTTPLTGLQQAEDWSLQTINWDPCVAAVPSVCSGQHQVLGRLQDTRVSLATSQIHMTDHYPSSPTYYSDIGSSIPPYQGDMSDSQGPSQPPSQELSRRRRSSLTALDSIFHNVCFERCCDGRVFSSASNLRRHQRERSRRAQLSICPLCRRGFYRRWTRDQHLLRLSCRRYWHSRRDIANTYYDDIRTQQQR
ncbi:hypothetical protein D6D19_10507 [Aureobasidium pullulans]|uniref:C2H2-type domain-containing protein n=1 Tax=Aureobasidium pullulans TaxID=5580 RepID=A0A4S9KAI9_AURPU|nr:hypothetical protein D6D19_10507 [Aureobasidium pullulans]THY11670.1 hypothetical protein D6D00_10573 [Aureobasidium pullulans]